VSIGIAAGMAGSADALRHVMGRFVTGVTVVTALLEGTKHAMTATAVSSVSLDPPLILVCVSRTSRFHEAVTSASTWCVSLLGADQEPIARHFANRGRDLLSQFDRVPHLRSPVSGTPLIAAAVAWLECRTYGRYDGGDHTILVGEVVRASSDEPGPATPLTYHQGTYSPYPLPPE
jgi:flavin reductase (DIM6/NTAB) family NADH-FMN oxidoreductase RutF